ncbi:Topoisomerase 1-associated factor 1 [Boothiomyces sp. JEL0866]|nr:Topoisomerase 1-associated factor 1 [Boothiomyces sp. JEL0866]
MISESDDKSEKIFQNHVLSVCNALGGHEQDVYVPGDEAYDCLRDLKRFIKMDENEGAKNSYFLLGKWNIMTSDLIPLFLHAASSPDITKENMRISLGSLDVMVSLTMPLKEKDINLIQFYKTKRDELHKQKFLLPITLIRNILAIDDIQEATSMSNNQYVKSKLQEELVEKMNQEGIIEFILSLAGSLVDMEFRSLNTVVLEIFHHIFYGRNISELFQTTETAKSNLQDLLKKEKSARFLLDNIRKSTNSRHSRFGGTFAVKTNSGQQVHTTSVPTHIGESLDKTKKLNPRGAKYDFDNVIEKPFILNNSIATHKDIVVNFYENCFNVVMSSVKRDFDIDSTAIVDEDFRHYFSVLGFVLSYFLELPNNERSFENIAGVINYPTIFLIFKKLDTYRNEKLLIIDVMYRSNLNELIDLSVQLLSNLFYEQGNIHLLVGLTRDSAPRGQNDEEAYHQQSFERLFGYESVIATYVTLLEHYEVLPEKYIKYILEMLQCISNTHQCDKEALLYQVAGQSEEDIVKKYSVPASDKGELLQQIRSLSEIISKNSRGNLMVKWISRIMRLVMYDDLDDFNVNKESGILVSNFIWESAAPYDAEEYLAKESLQFLLALLGFTKAEATWKFPKEIDLETLENLEKLTLFSKTTKIGKGLKRSAKATLKKVESFETNEITIEDETEGLFKPQFDNSTKKRARIIEFSDEDE